MASCYKVVKSKEDICITRLSCFKAQMGCVDMVECYDLDDLKVLKTMTHALKL